MSVYLLQQENWPYETSFAYYENVERRQAQENSNTSLASRRCCGRMDWLLAMYASMFPANKAGHDQAKAADHYPEKEMKSTG